MEIEVGKSIYSTAVTRTVLGWMKPLKPRFLVTVGVALTTGSAKHRSNFKTVYL